MRAARWTTPSLRLRSVVTGTSQLSAPFEPNPTLLRSPLPSQCPTEITEGILPHPVEALISQALQCSGKVLSVVSNPEAVSPLFHRMKENDPVS